MNKRSASVDKRGHVLIVASYSQTVDGFWVMNSHFRIIPADADRALIGATVREALGKSTQNVAVPDRESDPMAPLRAALGVKTYAAYAKGNDVCRR